MIYVNNDEIDAQGEPKKKKSCGWGVSALFPNHS